MITDRDRILLTIRTVLAADCCCDERNFATSGLTVVPAGNHPARRRFPLPTRARQIITMGDGIVVSCHPDRIAWIRATRAGQSRDAIFSAPILAQLSSYVGRENQILAGPDLKYACSIDRFRPAPEPRDVEVTDVDEERIAELYRYPGFPNALAYR